jgi:hypothetical protein
VELIAPGESPAEWKHWDEERRAAFLRRRRPADWWLLVEGVEGGNGGGDEVTAEGAARLTEAFTTPYDYGRVRRAGFYDDAGFCGELGMRPVCQSAKRGDNRSAKPPVALVSWPALANR